MAHGASMRVGIPRYTNSLVDYIFFITAETTLKLNENEVCDTKWVSMDELKQLMTELDRTWWYDD